MKAHTVLSKQDKDWKKEKRKDYAKQNQRVQTRLSPVF